MFIQSVKRRLLTIGVSGLAAATFTEGQLISWDEVEPALTGWAQDFKKRIDATHGC
jgi:hypothetical protein